MVLRGTRVRSLSRMGQSFDVVEFGIQHLGQRCGSKMKYRFMGIETIKTELASKGFGRWLGLRGSQGGGPNATGQYHARDGGSFATISRVSE